MKHARLFGIIKTVNLPNICFMADKQTVAGVQGCGDPPPSTSTATPTQRMYDKIHTAASVADVSTTSYTHTNKDLHIHKDTHTCYYCAVSLQLPCFLLSLQCDYPSISHVITE